MAAECVNQIYARKELVGFEVYLNATKLYLNIILAENQVNNSKNNIYLLSDVFNNLETRLCTDYKSNTVENETAEWLFKVAWNAALESVEINDYEVSYKLLKCCDKNLNRMGPEMPLFEQRPMILFLSVLAIVSHIRSEGKAMEAV